MDMATNADINIEHRLTEVEQRAKLYSTEYVELTTAQKKQYRDIKNGIVADMENILASVNPLNCTLRLRQLTSGNPNLTDDSPKLDRIKEMLEEEIIPNGHKAIIFSQWSTIAKDLGIELSEYDPIVITGEVPPEQRQRLVDNFQTNPHCKVAITKDKTYEAGTVHCYTCGYTADLPQFVADLLGLSSPVEGFKWLVNQYNYQTEERELPDLDMYRGSTAKSSVLEESLVKQYTQNLLQSEEACRYLHKRRIANWVLEAYELGFDPEDKTVLFPVRGMDGKVIFYKGRSIAGKHFYNAKEVDKTSVVFGLWEILNGSFSWGTSDQIEEVWITESEIDALSLISYGVPAVRSQRS